MTEKRNCISPRISYSLRLSCWTNYGPCRCPNDFGVSLSTTPSCSDCSVFPSGVVVRLQRKTRGSSWLLIALPCPTWWWSPFAGVNKRVYLSRCATYWSLPLCGNNQKSKIVYAQYRAAGIRGGYEYDSNEIKNTILLASAPHAGKYQTSHMILLSEIMVMRTRCFVCMYKGIHLPRELAGRLIVYHVRGLKRLTNWLRTSQNSYCISKLYF